MEKEGIVSMEPYNPLEHGALCDRCELHGKRCVPSVGPGPDEAKYVIIGESPGRQEAIKGEPFVGPSGKLLNAALEQVGIKREDCYITNVVLCHPGKPTPPEAIETCLPRLRKELERYRTQPILLLGAVSGAVLDRPKIRRGLWEGRYFQTWHPAYILRRPSAATEFLRDMEKFSQGEPEPFEKVEWIVPKQDEVNRNRSRK